MPKLHHKFGFTLIELLITIAIAATLASFIIYSFSGAQAKARDARRKADLNLVMKTLEHVKGDCSNAAWYPYLNPAVSAKVAYNSIVGTTGLVGYLKSPSLNYLKSVPVDPKNDATYYYAYASNTSAPLANVCPNYIGTLNSAKGITDYRLTATLEIAADPDIAKSKANCPWSTDFYQLADYTTSPVYVVCPQ